MSTGDRQDAPPDGRTTVEIERPPDPAAAPRRRRRRDTLRGIPVPRRSLRGRMRDYFENVEERAADSNRRAIIYPAYVVRVLAQVVRQWARDRCPQQASSLAFQLVLSIVPITAVALAVLRITGSLGEQSALVHFLSGEFIPISEHAISEQLLSWSENVSFESLGTIGLITTVILGFVMVNSLEKIANHIWRAEKKRSLAQKFVVFYATATVGPALLAISLYQAGEVGLTEGLGGAMLSFGTTFLAMFLANYFLPACHVRPRAALVGALVATFLFEISKYAFKAYVTEFALERYQGIYGAVAVAPLLLLWIYYCWLTTLFGFELAHAVQNLHLLERVDRRTPMSLENELLQRVNGPTAAHIMVAVTRAYVRGDKVVTRRQLENEFDLSDEVLNRITNRLKRQDLLIEVEGDLNGFLPARPPSEISLASVLRAFRGEDLTAPDSDSGQSSQLDKVLTDIEADTLQRTAHLYLDKLI